MRVVDNCVHATGPLFAASHGNGRAARREAPRVQIKAKSLAARVYPTSPTRTCLTQRMRRARRCSNQVLTVSAPTVLNAARPATTGDRNGARQRSPGLSMPAPPLPTDAVTNAVSGDDSSRRIPATSDLNRRRLLHRQNGPRRCRGQRWREAAAADFDDLGCRDARPGPHGVGDCFDETMAASRLSPCDLRPSKAALSKSHGRERQRRPTLTIVSTIHATCTGRSPSTDRARREPASRRSGTGAVSCARFSRQAIVPRSRRSVGSAYLSIIYLSIYLEAPRPTSDDLARGCYSGKGATAGSGASTGTIGLRAVVLSFERRSGARPQPTAVCAHRCQRRAVGLARLYGPSGRVVVLCPASGVLRYLADRDQVRGAGGPRPAPCGEHDPSAAR